MLQERKVLEMQIMYNQGYSLKHIARITGYSINTVRKYARDNKEPIYSSRPNRLHKLDGFRDYLQSRVRAASPNWIPATVLMQEIRELGYTGWISLLRAYLQTLKPRIKEYPLIRFETEPGEQMQVDFASFNYNGIKFYAFVSILGYSRMSYAEFVLDQKIDTLISCHENAFSYFNGIPRSVLYDNMKTVVIKRNAYGLGHHKLNINLYDFAKHYGFVPMLCKPYRPQTKGKIERMISYLRNSFYVPHISRVVDIDNFNIDDLNTALMTWLDDVANIRVHATTKETPLARWEIEKTHLQKIPNIYTGSYGLATCNNYLANNTIMNTNSTSIQHSLDVYQELLQGGVA